MKIYLDVTNQEFYYAIFNKNQIIYRNFIPQIKKKVELIPKVFEDSLKEVKLKMGNIEGFYLNVGPGYFTGVRIGLVFFRTLALLLNKPIYTISSFEILKKQNPDKKHFYIDAQGKKAYFLDLDNLKNQLQESIQVIDFVGEFDKIDYFKFEKNFENYLNLFKKYDYSKVLEIEPLYIKKPQIGEKK
ncbi:tRNA (adenosine(37)-N6)-threonylcarbamoyltransferase complex dimerization subunit type 1 TsaB [Mycoplasmopsis ciconiae]|uniref:tRNA (Adenosine(37)-N6)-threonylcarbamoyltransferase complex dimerization subunit type 1 TsaB n=1 Tax=Mycoplasmopsis ciconiae TaxID=561067 RepID=A0ABU7MLV6_9BACT|nr:tRNA (adenosine(37)-N6)-threonylcarbamoyltransferase complex dimerization subunit type 1 TsaB [Mycoplasmopsis ciconiae]